MKKYILSIRSAGLWLGSCRLFDDTGTKELAKVSVKDTKKIRKNLSLVVNDDEGFELRYDDERLKIAIKGSWVKKVFSYLKCKEYCATNLHDSSVFFKMNYLGHEKWQIETDYEDFKKLVSICYGVVCLVVVQKVLNEADYSNLP